MTTQTQHAETFTRLHKKGDPVILFNIWDAGSAARRARRRCAGDCDRQCPGRDGAGVQGRREYPAAGRFGQCKTHCGRGRSACFTGFRGGLCR